MSDNHIDVRAGASYVRGGKYPPDILAHFVIKTARVKQMVAWYGEVFGARVVHEDSQLAFLTWDEESHRLALVKLPRLLRYVFPLARYSRKLYGIDHLAFTYHSIETLLVQYKRLKRVGIEPVWTINHGPTTSFYYEDPEGHRLEFQVENFPTAEETARFFASQEFRDNPIGVEFDPDYLVERLFKGDAPASLLEQYAGVRPGTTPRTNKKTLTWKTL